MEIINKEIEEWKDTFLQMANDDFFEVMKNYFGTVKTPFNKHSLISNLTTFLSTEETKKQIIKLIDSYDAKILSGIAILKNPDVDTLYEFASNNSSYNAFSLRLINLEERLLIYTSSENNRSIIKLNPILKDILIDSVISSDFIFPSINSTMQANIFPWLTDSLMLAFLSIIIKKPKLLKTDQTFRKKAEEELLTLIPELNREFCNIPATEVLKRSLLELDLLKIEEYDLNVNIEKLKNFSKIKTQNLFLNLISSTLLPFCEGKTKDIDTKRKLTALFSLISSLLKTLPDDKAYSKKTFGKFIDFYTKDFSDLKFNYNMIIEGLCQHNLLEKVEDNKYKKNPLIKLERKTDYSEYQQIIMGANFEITLKPGANFSRAIIIPLIADLEKFDTYPQYVINKESFFRTLNYGYDVKKITRYLEDMNKESIPQNILITFENWEKEFREVRLLHGIVLKVSPEKEYLVESTQKLDKWILEKLGKGLYLFSQDNIVQWSVALEELGISPLPKIEYLSEEIDLDFNKSRVTVDETRTGINLNLNNDRKKIMTQINKNIKENEKDCDFSQLIDKLRFTKVQKDDMHARVERKLILFPDQITNNKSPSTVREASGLDYRGKLLQVKEALKNKNEILEITTINSPEDNLSLLIQATELRKEGNIYTLEGYSYPLHESFSIEIGKILKVRRLRTSLFAPR